MFCKIPGSAWTKMPRPDIGFFIGFSGPYHMPGLAIIVTNIIAIVYKL